MSRLSWVKGQNEFSIGPDSTWKNAKTSLHGGAIFSYLWKNIPSLVISIWIIFLGWNFINLSFFLQKNISGQTGSNWGSNKVKWGVKFLTGTTVMQLPVHWFLNRTSIALLTCDIGILNLTVTVPLTFLKSLKLNLYWISRLVDRVVDLRFWNQRGSRFIPRLVQQK